MPSTLSSLTSDRFFDPLHTALAKCDSPRICPVLPDSDWLTLGVTRVVSEATSGRGFLQDALGRGINAPSYGLFFEALKSKRRLTLCREINEHISYDLRRSLPDALGGFPELDKFEVRAGDGHWHGAASHDPAQTTKKGTTTKYPVGHLYTLCLRTHHMRHLMTNDQVNRKKEHDMRALKRTGAAELRQDVAKGRKLLMVWDSAAIDFGFWHQLKQGHGVYFICREKEIERMKCGDRPWNRDNPINQGVEKDELVGSANGHMARRVTFIDPASGKTHIYLTNETTLEPGLLSLIYRMRWDIEKVFDEVKNHLLEKKAWATSATAKSMQGHFIAITHNLMLSLEHQLRQSDVSEDPVEKKRRESRRKIERLKSGWVTELKELAIWLGRSTQRGLKFIRWLRGQITSATSWEVSCRRLCQIYARF